MNFFLLSISYYILNQFLNFDKTEHNFGAIKENKIYNANFSVTNNSNKSISILNVSTTCGCTIAQYPTIINPKERAIISTTLNTKGLHGEIERRLIVVTTSEQQYYTLTLKGIIK